MTTIRLKAEAVQKAAREAQRAGDANAGSPSSPGPADRSRYIMLALMAQTARGQAGDGWVDLDVEDLVRLVDHFPQGDVL